MTNQLKKTQLQKSISTIYNKVEKAQMVLHALDHTLRRDILHFLDNSTAPSTVTDLYILLRQEQPVISQQLAILRKENIVIGLRDGKYVYYSVNNKRIGEIRDAITRCLYPGGEKEEE